MRHFILVSAFHVFLIVTSSVFWSAHAQKPSWEITFILDQSGSMRGVDRAQYALLIPSVIADLSDLQTDQVSVIGQDGCKVAPCSTIWELGSNKDSFKQSLAQLPSDSHFTAPMKTALQRHSSSQGHDQSIVSLVYDDANMQNKSQIDELRNMIKTARQDGYIFVMSDAIDYMNLFGPKNGKQVGDSKSLLRAYSDFFKKLFRAKEVPTGESSPNSISVPIAPGAKESWVVIISDSEITQLYERGTNPGARSVELMPRNTGFTFAGKGLQRTLSYQLVHIDAPKSGTWQFRATTQSAQVSWLILSLYELPISNIQVNGVPYIGGPLDCHSSGCEITADLPPGVTATGSVSSDGHLGHKANFRCDSQGKCKATYRPRSKTDQNLTINFETKQARSDDKLKIQPTQNPSAFSGNCPAQPPFIFPTHTTGGIVYNHYRINSAQMPQPAQDQTDVTLKFDGQDIKPTQTTVRAATVQDQSRYPLLQIGDWVTEFRFNGISSDTPKVVHARMVTIEDSSNQECPVDFEFLPIVDLKLSIPESQLLVEECSGSASGLSEGCADCGGCSQRSFKISYALSYLSDPITAELSLVSPLPDGVTLFIGEQEVAQNTPIPVDLSPSGDRMLNATLCGNYCPTSVTGASMGLKLRKSRILAPNTGDQITTAEATATTNIDVEGSSWWVCWLPEIKLAIYGLSGFLFLLGFWVPCRFPRQSRGSVPYAFKSAKSRQLTTITSTHTELRRAMPPFRWYRNDYAYLKVDDALLAVDAKRGICKLVLKGCKPYLVPSDDSIYELQYRSNAAAGRYSIRGKKPLPQGEPHPINSTSIYYHKSEDFWVKFET